MKLWTWIKKYKWLFIIPAILAGIAVVWRRLRRWFFPDQNSRLPRHSEKSPDEIEAARLRIVRHRDAVNSNIDRLYEKREKVWREKFGEDDQD